MNPATGYEGAIALTPRAGRDHSQTYGTVRKGVAPYTSQDFAMPSTRAEHPRAQLQAMPPPDVSRLVDVCVVVELRPAGLRDADERASSCARRRGDPSIAVRASAHDHHLRARSASRPAHGMGKLTAEIALLRDASACASPHSSSGCKRYAPRTSAISTRRNTGERHRLGSSTRSEAWLQPRATMLGRSRPVLGRPYHLLLSHAASTLWP